MYLLLSGLSRRVSSMFWTAPETQLGDPIKIVSCSDVIFVVGSKGIQRIHGTAVSLCLMIAISLDLLSLWSWHLFRNNSGNVYLTGHCLTWALTLQTYWLTWPTYHSYSHHIQVFAYLCKHMTKLTDSCVFRYWLDQFIVQCTSTR